MTEHTQNIGFNLNRSTDVKSDKIGPTPRKTKKDFNKILEKEPREEKQDSDSKELVGKQNTEGSDSSYEDVELKLEAYDTKPKKPSSSLFDLAREPVAKVGKTIELEAEPIVSSPTETADKDLSYLEIPENMQNESLSALFKGYGTKEKLQTFQNEVNQLPAAITSLDVKASRPATAENGEMGLQQPSQINQRETSDSPVTSPLPPSPKSERTNAFSIEQQDLAAVNPIAGLPPAVETSSVRVQEVHTPIRAQELQEIVDQIVSKLYTVSTTGKTDTVIKLKHPPMFEGTNIVVRSFDTAKGELNIAFENMTQAAKQMMDLQENQNSLKFALEQRGFTVHMITATTISELSQIVEGQSSERENREGKGGSSQKEKEQQQEKED
jgi:hypothetical protein